MGAYTLSWVAMVGKDPLDYMTYAFGGSPWCLACYVACRHWISAPMRMVGQMTRGCDHVYISDGG